MNSSCFNGNRSDRFANDVEKKIYNLQRLSFFPSQRFTFNTTFYSLNLIHQCEILLNKLTKNNLIIIIAEKIIS